MPILKAGVLYFVLVFGPGFVLGTIRTLWVVPRFGTRMAEPMETPIMLVITILAAQWTVRHLAVPSTLPARLGVGFVALGLLLVAEFTLVLWLRGMSIREYFASRDLWRERSTTKCSQCLRSCHSWWLENETADPIPCCALTEILPITREVVGWVGR
ncbi:MAG TPA: hypothetical protein VN948_18895 [Terriglobales bacterium]|nr:hypothetical protein [Terriglobales bacterium]